MENSGTEGAPRGDGPSLRFRCTRNRLCTLLNFSLLNLVHTKFTAVVHVLGRAGAEGFLFTTKLFSTRVNLACSTAVLFRNLVI